MDPVTIAIILTTLSIALSVVSTAVMATQTPELEDATPAGLGDFNFPTNLESRYIPVVFGSTDLNAPNVIWYGDFSTRPLDTAGQIVGYQYFLGLDLALCYGPLDAISEIQMDDKYLVRAGEQNALASGNAPDAGYTQTPSGQRTISLLDRNFFGGPKQGGGVNGNLVMFFGTDNQIPSAYVQAQEEDNLITLPDASEISQSLIVPAYRGISHVVWEGGNLSERAVIPNIKFRVHRYPRQLSGQFAVVDPDANGFGDANPIHCIYEILTDTRWGLSIPETAINWESFFEAAEQCSTEGLGFGYVLDSTTSAKKVIDIINEQVNGMLYQNEEGLYEYHLIRNDYSKESMYLLDYKGDLRFDTASTLVSDTADIVSSGDQYIIQNFGSAQDLSGLVVGEVVRVNNGSDDFFLSIASFDDGADTITLDTIQGFLYSALPGVSLSCTVSRLTGLETVPDFTVSNIIKVRTADRQSWDETFNTIQLKYIDRTDFYKEAVATSHDMGNLAIRNGVQTIKKVDAPGIRTPTAASIVAQRRLRTFSYPITSVSLEVPRAYSNLRPSDVIRINHPDFGLNDFFLRVLEITLPTDRGGSVIVKGIRDTFDEPALSDVIHAGGEADLSAPIIVTVVPPNTDEVLVDGLPLFLHNRLDLGSEYHAWHVIGQPSPATSFGVARQFSSDTYFDVSDSGSLVPVGDVVGHPDELWEDEPGVDKDWYDRTDTSATGDVYGPNAGPVLSPTRANSNGTDAWDVSGGKAKNDKGNFLPNANGALQGRSMGDVIVTDTSVSASTLLDQFTEAAIQEFGFGLALIRPAWADGDTRFDEIIAYERAELFTLYYGSDEVFRRNTATRRNTTETVFSVQTTPQENVISTRSGLNLFDVHRGLLDTGIQQINGGSKIFFLSAGDTLYDLVGLSGPTPAGQTYRHQTLSPGGQMDMADGFDVAVTSEQLLRRDKFMPPKMITVDGGAYNEAWGNVVFDNGNWQDQDFPSGGPGNSIDLDWSYKNLTTNADQVNFYDETDATPAGVRQYITFNLIDDNRVTETERLRHARAYWKEGWMPTNPATSHQEDLSTDVAFVDTVTTSAISGTALNAYNLQGALTGTFTSGQDYYCEVIWRSGDTGAADSHGAQRTIMKFEAV